MAATLGTHIFSVIRTLELEGNMKEFGEHTLPILKWYAYRFNHKLHTKTSRMVKYVSMIT